jgi:ribose transport system ATP-binding protein
MGPQPQDPGLLDPPPPAAVADWALWCEGLTKTFGATRVLSQVSLGLMPGRIHVLVGQNGSGKSTLIKILSGYHEPDPGTHILLRGQRLPFGSAEGSYRLGCRFVHQDLGLVENLAVVDNMSILSGYPTRLGTIRRSTALRAAAADLARIGSAIDPKTQVASLTPAQRTEISIARAIRPDESAPATLLVLDEPAASLAPAEVGYLFRTIRAAAATGVAILYVTHHLSEVFTIGDDVSVLRDGRLVLSAPTADVDKRQLLEHLFGSALNDLDRARREPAPAGQPPVLSVTDLRGPALRGVSIQACAGEVVGIAGLTGSGRETVLPVIFGWRRRLSGQVTINGTQLPPDSVQAAIGRGVAYLPPDRRSAGVMPMSAFDNLTLPRLHPHWSRLRLRRRSQRELTRHWFGRLGVNPADAVSWPLERFSGGNQQKILLGKWLTLRPRLLLLDEPTQGVDAMAKLDLHTEILGAADQGSAVVLSSTDVDELTAICDRIYILADGVVIQELSGDDISSVTVAAAFTPTATNS